MGESLNCVEREDLNERYYLVSACAPKSTRERYLLAGVIVLLALFILLAIIFGSYAKKVSTASLLKESTNEDKPPSYGICLTKGCVQAAALINERMNKSADPCEDFYEFLCGNFIRSTKIPDEKSSVTMFSHASDMLKRNIRLLVEDEIRDTDTPATVKVKKLYASCLDLERIEKRGLEPLHKILSNMGGWPVVEGDNWDEENFSWMKSIYKNRNYGFSINPIFIFDVEDNIENSSRKMIWLDQPILTLPREYFLQGLNNSDVQNFLQYSIDVAVLLGANRSESTQDQMTDVMMLIIRLSEISMSREERRNVQYIYNVMTVRDLKNIAPTIPWIEFINNILPKPLKVDDDEEINLGNLNFFKNLTNLLDKTPKRVLANYLLMKIVMQSATFLSEDIRKIDFEFSRKFTGRATRRPRWEDCISMISRSLSYAVSNLYVNNFFKKSAKKQVQELVVYLKSEFEDMLKSVDWMDDLTRTEALKKLKAINSYVAYPEELLEDDKLTEYYSNITIGKDLLENNLHIAVSNSDFYYGKLRKISHKNDWKERGAVVQVNAFYSTVKNSIELPAGILQGVFFQSNRPKYLNFGGIGFVIGHELTHGFDDQGKQYNEDGNLKEWWQPDTEKKFLDRASCIIEQYGNYTAPSGKLNGIFTQGENIADNGGIRIAYRAYRKWVKDHGVEDKLPGLNYTPNQLFWISSGQIWCSVYRPEFLRNKLISDNHSPENFRVNGPLSNFEKFARDWNCPADTKMNPKHRCVVW